MRERLRDHLQTIRDAGNYREVKYLKPLSSTRVLFQDREYLNLCSNSYLSLHFDPRVMGAAQAIVDRYGAGTCSSRSVSGSIDIYERVEEGIARFKGYERALIFSNGYMANMGIIATLIGKDDIIFSDALNHSSLIDSIRLSGAKTVIYRHLDMADLEDRLKEADPHGLKFLITETVFSMDGDVAPLSEIYRLKQEYGLTVIVDEAHATGVFGEKGRGVEEVYGLSGKMDVQMGTFGKALGSFGAFALSDSVIIEYLINRARTFMYTTALPAGILAAAEAALRLIEDDRSIKNRLWENIAYMRQNLRGMGFDLKESEGPIVPILVGEDATAVKMQEMLMEEGMFLQAIRPPTVPSGTSRLRLTVVRDLTRDDMDQALEALADTGRKVGLI